VPDWDNEGDDHGPVIPLWTALVFLGALAVLAVILTLLSDRA